MSAVGQELERTAREGHWIMHDGEVHIGVFCVVCAYMMTVGGLAVWAFYQNRQDGALSGKKEEAYFLAGRSFGWFILFLTMFSSLFSGITVIFVPLEAAWSGYRRVGRWWSFTGALACGPAMLLANYRSVGIARNHKTVAEFFTDRYRSVVFTLIMVFTVGYSAIPYMTAQFVALRDSISVLTGSADLGMVAATAFAYYIFFAEMIGGMRGVALTDAFQTGVMLICYSLLPLVIMYWWGGFSSFVQPDCENGLPGANEYASGTLFCQVMGCNDDGCTGSWSEDAYECTPTWSIKPGCDGNPPLTEKTACDIECTGLAFAADLGTCTGCFIDGTTEITAESVVTLSPGSTLCAPVIAASSKATEACGAPGGYNTSLPVDKTSAHPAFVPNGGGCTGCYGTAARIPWGDPAKFIRYPDAWQGDYMTWKQFGMILNALLLSPQPHFFARWVAARSDLQLKQGMIPLLWAPLLMISVGILVGTVWMGLHGPQFYTNMDGGLSPVSPFAGLMDDLIDKGGFSEMLSTVMMCAAIAAFMSTADSLCIAFSSQLSIDVFQNIAWRKLKWGDATGTIKLGQTSVTLGDQTIYFSKLASFILITVSLADAWDVDTNLSDLFDHFFGLATYGAPAGFYATTNLFGCGKRASSLALILGCLAGYLTYLILFWLKNEAMCKGMDEGHSCTPRPEDVPEVLVGYDVFAAIINFLVATIACYLLPQTLRDSDNTFTRPAFLKWDEPDKAMLDNYGGKRLTYDEAKAIVDRKRVPTNTGGWLILLGCFAFLTAMLPWYDGGGTTGPGRQRQGFFATWGEEKYTPPVPTSFPFFGWPDYFCMQFLSSLVVLPVTTWVVLAFWDSDDEDASGMPKLKKPLFQMTTVDVREWVAGNWNPEIAAWAGKFVDAEIDGPCLSAVTYQSLVKIVSADGGESPKVGLVLKVLQDIEKLKTYGWRSEPSANDLSINFTEQGPMGITWQYNADNQVVVLEIAAGRPAAGKPGLVIGLPLLAINQKSTNGRPYNDIINTLKTAGRPLALTFQNPKKLESKHHATIISMQAEKAQE